ncbi:7293_t:CDS:1, partial [Racocetra persica]
IVDNFSIVHNLPISPAFGVFIAYIQDESITEGETAAFHLKRNAYDGIISFQVTMSIL